MHAVNSNLKPLPTPLRGVIPPLVTPLEHQDAVDHEGLEHLIEHVLAGGVHGLFLLGTTGEAPSLGHAVRHDLIRRACKQVAGRVPVLVGITDSSPAESIRLANYAADHGAKALVLAAPFYFPIQQADLLEYLRDIVPQLPLPVFIYNMPTHTKINFSAETVRQAMALPNVVGLKDSSAGAACFMQVKNFVRQERPDFSLLIGPEEMLAESLPLGAHGGVCGGANVFPRLFVDLYDAVLAGNRATAAALQKQVLKLAETIYALGTPGYASIRGIKGALASLGICSDCMSSPLQQLDDADRAHIQRCMAELELSGRSTLARNVVAK